MRSYPLDIYFRSEEHGRSQILMSKGHHNPIQFTQACEKWNDGPLRGWGDLQHTWFRTVPRRNGELTEIKAPPHARGAYPVTLISMPKV